MASGESVMARDEAYREAERRIEMARQEGATELDLSNMMLTELPEAIGQLVNLKVLNLGGSTWAYDKNQLTTLPKWLGNLTQLQSLNLSHNQLTTLPEWLGNLTQLQSLNLSGNYQLRALPETIGNCSQLQLLLLSSTDVTTLPSSLGKLTSLTELDLSGTALSPELDAAYTQGIKAILQYLRSIAEDQIVLNEAKLILIGEGEVGKTSLLGALRGDEWVENRKTTHGVEVNIKSLVVTNSNSGTEITLNGWDFGGQNIYRHTHQIFFTAPAIYLAVWNPRRGPEQCRLDEWIKMVKHRAYDETRPDEHPRILVIATHGGPKERLDHIDEQTLRDEFGNLIVGFRHVDSKTEYGLDELKQIIALTATKIPQVGRSVPASWKRVLDAVRKRSKTDAWVSYEQFQTLCANATDLDQAREETRTAIRAKGSVLRELHALLKAEDSAGGFGGLERVQNKRREFLWVHPQFVSEY